MAFSAEDIHFKYSGGAANSNPQASLGGIASSVRVVSQTASSPVNITGVTIVSVDNNAQGNGLLTWSSATNTLTWQPPTSVYQYGVNITVNGTYAFGGSDGSIVVTAVFASLPTSYKQDVITIANASGAVFDTVAPLDSLVGSTEYRCLYVKNVHATVTAGDVRIWIKTLTNGPDEITIGLDPAGVGDGSTTGVATTIADEDTAPSGVSFSTPLSYATGLVIGDLAPGECCAIWERRVVPAGTVGNVEINKSALSVAAVV